MSLNPSDLSSSKKEETWVDWGKRNWKWLTVATVYVVLNELRAHRSSHELKETKKELVVAIDDIRVLQQVPDPSELPEFNEIKNDIKYEIDAINYDLVRMDNGIQRTIEKVRTDIETPFKESIAISDERTTSIEDSILQSNSKIEELGLRLDRAEHNFKLKVFSGSSEEEDFEFFEGGLNVSGPLQLPKHPRKTHRHHGKPSKFLGDLDEKETPKETSVPEQKKDNVEESAPVDTPEPQKDTQSGQTESSSLEQSPEQKVGEAQASVDAPPVEESAPVETPSVEGQEPPKVEVEAPAVGEQPQVEVSAVDEPVEQKKEVEEVIVSDEPEKASEQAKKEEEEDKVDVKIEEEDKNEKKEAVQITEEKTEEEEHQEEAPAKKDEQTPEVSPEAQAVETHETSPETTAVAATDNSNENK